ncbi:His-Xaa-Ser system radical SAM maturase HxsB [Paraburkholderia caballeronis]|uniref:His-Xaa-Ser system radical SAM maturase HxsB n=1 Tax=Paraburkholderia caballeronis TaxID=416943 RepID=A0A1H7MTF5_9BURK|nr:His-Xaa-Ser system radical SAM maturase HxsB [Paraburkholderia caballeronis]PXW26424.1 His-Xaa-Ser system radical SAM maturase HxsB [Paraburkholderia caballeronis]PXX01971.1 His-Xaa-Ser system radical SAM maturase HxsB [Paraburkholderia caballeronis]RAK01128.1 His-Xaa-Ser system radical SAM maturase HxsB [Paraburkholderia caballeronis]SEB96413.1 His-Xaa-Ser system radical SAM maturase HxsB [Paraburkholderia caballeronis]SEL14570.1 His-Xaa-Ser system radical SAM maturase HxsB [Paraburkholder
MSKFLPPSAFATDGVYSLLPFNFTRLDSERYVATNMVGEYVTLDRGNLERLVGHELHPAETLFRELRAKHFIEVQGDRSPRELLALKTRTRYQRLPNFTNLHIFVATLRCDHSCPYCQVSRQSEDRAAFDMSYEIADHALDLMFRSPSPALKLEFQGGEPLLNFDLVRYIVEKAEQRARIASRELEVVIATTLSLATQKILEYCRDHHILLSTSLDGPANLHNRNRPRPGRDSYERYLQGLQKAREIVGFDRVSALMTTTQHSLSRVREIIDEYVTHGFDGIFLRPLSPYGFAVKTKTIDGYDLPRWLDFYFEGLEYVLELNRSGVPFREHYAALVLQKMLTSNDPGYVDLMNPAGIGTAAVVFNYDGGVFASDEARMLAEMGDTTFKLGNVLENSYEDIFLSEQLLGALEDSFTLSVPMCSECAFEPFCGADPIYAHAVHGDVVGRKPSSDFCRRNMTIFRRLIAMMESDSSTKDIFQSWVAQC